jgi:hypothetical protein
MEPFQGQHQAGAIPKQTLEATAIAGLDQDGGIDREAPGVRPLQHSLDDIGSWAPWLPFALPQRWPFCWWVAVVIDHYSRRVMGIETFRNNPTAISVSFLTLLWRVIKAGHIEQGLFCAASEGVPQGVLSPLLSNVMLREFDSFLEERYLSRKARAARWSWNHSV